MDIHKLRIQVGGARAALGRAYERHHRPIKFDVVVQAHLHCRRVAGIQTPYDAEIDSLEQLEDQLEIKSDQIELPRWRARRMYMQDLMDSGSIRGEENIERAAAFMERIEAILAGNEKEVDEPEAEDRHLLGILHPVIVDSSWPLYRSGHLRDAVLNAMVALGDLIRTRTGLSQDGKPLVEQALSIREPRLVLSNLSSESGRNDQLGFMQIISGAFVGVRNPKAHSLQHDLDKLKAAQYLVFASLLARRIADAQKSEI